MGSGGVCHYCGKSNCICRKPPLAADEIALIRKLLEAHVSHCQISQSYIRDTWMRSAPEEKAIVLGEYANQQKLAESALRSLERLDNNRGPA